MTSKQISIIQELFRTAEQQELPLWLEGGWAIDARLGRVTRRHEDIDIAYPEEKQSTYIQLLEKMGFGEYEELDYGFLMNDGNILVDSEPCYWKNGFYMPDGFPKGSCPFKKEGAIEKFKIRCLSWEAMYFEFLNYESERPKNQWRLKDHISLKIIENHLTQKQMQHLMKQHAQSKNKKMLK